MCAEDEGWPILLDRIMVTWLSPASQNLPLGLCGQHSWGRYCFSARVVRVWECESGPLYVSSSCSWTYICTRAEHIGANDISESQGVMKLISPSDFCYATQCIPLLFKINKRLARVLCWWVVLTQGAFQEEVEFTSIEKDLEQQPMGWPGSLPVMPILSSGSCGTWMQFSTTLNSAFPCPQHPKRERWSSTGVSR